VEVHIPRTVLETRQKEMEVTVSEMAGQASTVLTSIAANIVALEDLKAMFTKFLANSDCSGDGSGSVSISALETQGGTRAPSMEPDDARCRGLLRSPDQEILSVSASEGEQPPERPQIRSPEKVFKKGAVASRSLGSKKGATVVVSRVPLLKSAAGGKDTSVQPSRKDVAPTCTDRAVLKKEAAAKESQGAALKKRAIMKEFDRDGVRKGPTAKELEEDDVYRLDTCVQATPTAVAIQKSIVETSPRKTVSHQVYTWCSKGLND
jgi:hypothetical protein